MSFVGLLSEMFFWLNVVIKVICILKDCIIDICLYVILNCEGSILY